MMYPFNNSGLNPAAMMNMNFGGGAPSRRVPSFGGNPMMMHGKMQRGSAVPAGNPTLMIRPNDVLCGRGKTSFNHSGNRRFRHIISQSIEEYRAATSKWEKSLVAARLVSVIHSSGGRFLKQKKENEDEWYELSSSESKSKVSHAIRDAIAATKQTRRTSTGDNRPKPAPATIPSSSNSTSLIGSGTIARTSCCTPMDDSSSATAATAPMDDSSSGDLDQSTSGRIHMTDDSSTNQQLPQESSSSVAALSDANSFVRPRYRGTWSSNSLVSLTDDGDEQESSSTSSAPVGNYNFLAVPATTKAKPDRATSSSSSRMNECWSPSSSCSSEEQKERLPRGGSNNDSFTDDFASYIHKVLGPGHP